MGEGAGIDGSQEGTIRWWSRPESDSVGRHAHGSLLVQTHQPSSGRLPTPHPTHLTPPMQASPIRTVPCHDMPASMPAARPAPLAHLVVTGSEPWKSEGKTRFIVRCSEPCRLAYFCEASESTSSLQGQGEHGSSQAWVVGGAARH